MHEFQNLSDQKKLILSFNSIFPQIFQRTLDSTMFHNKRSNRKVAKKTEIVTLTSYINPFVVFWMPVSLFSTPKIAMLKCSSPTGGATLGRSTGLSRRPGGQANRWSGILMRRWANRAHLLLLSFTWGQRWPLSLSQEASPHRGTQSAGLPNEKHMSAVEAPALVVVFQKHTQAMGPPRPRPSSETAALWTVSKLQPL